MSEDLRYSLAGRRAIVTGASRGLGLAIAEAFLAAGAEVLLGARTAGPLTTETDRLRALHGDGRVHSQVLDVADPSTVKDFVEAAQRRWRSLDVLVNNAGVYGPMGRLDETDWAEWTKTIKINLMGTVLVCRAVLPLLRAAGGGKIINLSGGGATMPLPRLSAYAVSKAGVVRLTETLSEELEGERIDVNAVAPGALNTRLLEEVLAAGPDKVGKEFYEKAMRQQADGGTPLSKGAALCVFLASRASDGITGKLISAAWDRWENLAKHALELKTTDVYTLRRIVPKDRNLDWSGD